MLLQNQIDRLKDDGSAGVPFAEACRNAGTTGTEEAKKYWQQGRETSGQRVRR